MIYNDQARRSVGNVFEFILIAAERSREINIRRNSDGTNSQLREKNSKMEYTHEQAVREITEGSVGRDYLQKVKSRKYRTKMR